MTLDELKAKLPAEWRPIVDEYGPAFLAMTAAETWAWLNLAVKGDAYAAYAAVIAKLDNAALIAEWGKINVEWAAANAANKAAMDWQRNALMAILKVLVAIAAVSVGL